ncbi:MAG: hypothetical protein JOZ69_03510, partial [Myxococcales bacterium]|nr:hypothetical protein [Myxococcales bacterium]
MRDAMPRIYGAAMVAAALAVPSQAWAAEGAPPSPAEREAQVRFEEGLARVKASNFEGARMSFTQAHAVLRKPPILWNLALAEEKSGHPVEAVSHFRLFARLAASSEDRAGAEKHIAALAGQVGRLDVDAPAGAEIVVDGVPAGVAPWAQPLDVSPGHHRVEARGRQGAREAFANVAGGQLARVSFAASEPASSAGEPATGAAPAAPALVRPEENRSGGEPGLPAGQEPSMARVLTVVGVSTAPVAS